MISRNEQLSNSTNDDTRFRGETGRVRYQPTDEYCVIPNNDSERPLGEALFYQLAEERSSEWQRPAAEPTQLTTGYSLEGEAGTVASTPEASADTDDIYRLEDSNWSQAG